MNFDSGLLLSLSLAVAVLGASAAALGLSFLPVLRWLYRLMEKEEEAQAAARRAAAEIIGASRQEADKALAAARAEGLKILQEAHAQAAQILANGQLFEDETNARREQAFQSVLGRHLNLLETAAQKMTADYEAFANGSQQARQKAEAANLQRWRALTGDLEEKMRSQLRGFEDILREQAAAAAKKLEEITTAYARQAQQAAADDKAARFRQLDETIFRLIFRVTEQVLGRALNLEEHQELIQQALHDAKRDETSQP